MLSDNEASLFRIKIREILHFVQNDIHVKFHIISDPKKI